MGRKATGWWSARSQRWLARLGPVNPKTGRRSAVSLRDPRGELIGEHDLAGRDAAIARLQGQEEGSSSPTVAEVCRLYLAWHAAHGSAPATIRTHYYHLTRFAKFESGGVRYADRPASSIVPGDLAALKRSGIGAVRHLYMSVLACWEWAYLSIDDREPDRLIPSNPLRDVKRPRGGQRPSRATPWPEVRRMLRLARGWAREPHRPFGRTRAFRLAKVWALMAMAYSGGRTAEIVTLEWGDIRWAEGVAAIPAGRTKGRRTGKMRYIPLLPRLLELLELLEHWPDRHGRYVFATRFNRKGPSLREWWRSIRCDLKPYWAERGVELPEGWRPYWLRHTVATQASRAVGKEKAAKAMGHSPQVLDSTYDHVEADRVREVGEAVARARRKP